MLKNHKAAAITFRNLALAMLCSIALLTGCNKGTPSGPSVGPGDSPTELSRAASRSTNGFSSPECTWGVDKMTERAGWRLTFSRTTDRNAYKWYGEKLVTNGNYGQIGKVGDIMVFKGWPTNLAGHVARITNTGYWNGKRAWTVRHSNWPAGTGQWPAEKIDNVQIYQCTFVEESPGQLRVQNGNSLIGSKYPLYGFIYKK